MNKEKIIETIRTKIEGQGNQLDIADVLPEILIEILDAIEQAKQSGSAVGDLAMLETDHKSDIVSALNEIFDVIETTEMVVSMTKPASEMKVIYDECVLRPQLAKNIVFYQPLDGMYYRVNGYKLTNNILTLNAIMPDPATKAPTNVTIQIASNGSISMP